MKKTLTLLTLILIFSLSYGQKTRARDLGVPFSGQTGEYNAITDVKGVEVGYSTIISGEGKNVVGNGPVRTGVTAIFPRGKESKFSPDKYITNRNFSAFSHWDVYSIFLNFFTNLTHQL